MTLWQRWLRIPQDVWLRKVLFQVHLWTGIGLGLYIVLISVTGGVLVYRNELYRAFEPEDGGPLPAGYRFTTWLLDLHDNLLAGETGRTVNGAGAALVLVLALTGAILWWPGIRNWRRGLVVDLRSNWKRLNWSLHSALGLWFLAFVLMWGITGLYLSFPQAFYSVAEFLEPTDYSSGEPRLSDRVLYWLAYAHFGRFGRRLPGCGPACDATLKAAWAAIALVPPVMFVTGVLMWWNRARRIPGAGTSFNAGAGSCPAEPK